MGSILPRLSSSAIPQADNPRILVRAWHLVAAGEPCDATTLGVHPRQVTYYRSALRILGLLGRDRLLPAAGDIDPDDAITSLTGQFEASECGRAWLQWSCASRLEDVDPASALAFLEARSDLSGTTLERRAATLRRWHAWMTRSKPAPESLPSFVEENDVIEGGGPILAPPVGHYIPRTLEIAVHWSHWTYWDWNARLVDQILCNSEGRVVEGIVTRIAATPEELARIADANPADASAVAEAFVARVIEQLPVGKKSFCGFCLADDGWSPRSSEAPHFFAMLWFTCLVAYGYPTGEGAFFERFWSVLGKFDNFQYAGKACLPRLWEDTASWTKLRHAAGDPVLPLELPPRTEHRAVIGYSHFLAFPNRVDRNALAETLWNAGLVGFEPPVIPVLTALNHDRKQFSQDFLEDFDAFVERYSSGEDPRDSAFWRAVRQEALEPSIDPSSKLGERSPRTGLLFLEDDGLRPIVGCRIDQALPEGFQAHPFEEPVTWPAYVTGPDEDLDVASRAAFDPDGRLLSVGARKLISQGVLVLRQAAGGQYDVVSGADIHGCRRALVKQPLVQAFIQAFPGVASALRTQPSLVDGWVEVDGCEVRQVDELPHGLASVTQLLRTMSPPSVALIGGIRVPGGFLLVPAFLPAVRAPDVRSVEVLFPDGRPVVPCIASTDTPGLWLLPPAVDRVGTIRLQASWSIRTNGGVSTRTSDTSVSFMEHVVADDYRGKPSGHHFVESCPEPEVDIQHLEEVPLGISAALSERSEDLLDLDVSARYLGPGVGEMALEPSPGFDWIVIGKKKRPELLVYIGDPTRPTSPGQRRSSSNGDRRLWKKGFEAKRQFARLSGRFIPLKDAPEAVRQAYVQYKRHQVLQGEECPETGLETRLEPTIRGMLSAGATSQASDVLAALACRRSGLTYADVREVFQALLGDDDPIHIQQVLRGWTEAGIIDILRDARMSRLTIVPRKPRFVMIRRGPDVEATLIGLIASVRQQRINGAVAQLDTAAVQQLLPANPWQPSTLRLRCTMEEVEAVRREADLGPSEWLDWPTRSVNPSCLDISAARDRLTRTAPPDSYRFESGWDWAKACFHRGHHSGEAVQLERRRHVDSSAIYVVVCDGQPTLWTHSRSWALLEAYARRGVAPFRAEGGVLTATGRAPVHLPLPLGRLCVLIGDALPGPTLGANTIRYSYPFGLRLFGLVEQVLPREWLDRPDQPSQGK